MLRVVSKKKTLTAKKAVAISDCVLLENQKVLLYDEEA